MNVGVSAIFYLYFFTRGTGLKLTELIACDHYGEVTLSCDDSSEAFVAIHSAVFTTNTSAFPSCDENSSGDPLDSDPGSDLDPTDSVGGRTLWDRYILTETDGGDVPPRPVDTPQEAAPFNLSSCTEDIRMPLNYRCSGQSSCTFDLSTHHPQRRCLDPGILVIHYECVPDEEVLKFCNRKVMAISEGYIKSPGYPIYYPGPLNCKWTISTGEGQHVSLSILDLSLTETLHGSDEMCPDVVSLHDGQVTLLRTCGERAQSLRRFESRDNSLTARLKTRGAGPRRGFLLWYKAVGCPTLTAPEHGYLVYRNVSFAQYMCCTNHLFEDTLERTRNFICEDKNKWNDTLAFCLDKKTLRETKNATGIELQDDVELDSIEKVPLVEADLLLDIWVPSAIMGILILGNAVIVIVLLHLRRTVKEDPEVEAQSPTQQMDVAATATATAATKPPPTPIYPQQMLTAVQPSSSANGKQKIVTDV